MTSIGTLPIPGAGRHVALVEDSPIQRKVLGDFLRELGFEVDVWASATEALQHLVHRQPHAILCDVVMPEIDGFALCRTIKDHPALAAIPVVLLTSTEVDESDRQLAARAGAEALVPRTPGFGLLVEALLASFERRENGVDGRGSVMADLRARFLINGRVEAARLAAELDGGENPSALKHAVHRWAGRGSTLGFPLITQQARALEAAIDAGDRGAARNVLAVISRLFHAPSSDGAPPQPHRPSSGREVAIPAAIVAGLADRRVALVGFPSAEADRMTEALALALARARPEPVAGSGGPAGSLMGYDLLVLSVQGERGSAAWPSSLVFADGETAILLVGAPEVFLRAAPEIPPHPILFAPWTRDGLLLRSFLAVQDAAAAGPRQPTRAPQEIVVADDDPTILALLDATLRNYGYRCHLAQDGVEAIEISRRVRPAALVLDINMPGRDGYEVLSTLRADRRTRGIPIVLLTARHQETDIIRAFDLGASEYVVKPFNPLELAARLRRLVAP